jgi:magnesium chelatase subunit I
VESTVEVSGKEAYPFMELALHGLAEYNVVNKDFLEARFSFRDLLADMLDDDLFGEDDDY